MKEKPILLNSEMVRAVLDGRKTQTRRVVRPPFTRFLDAGLGANESLCPFGAVGDRLWVREKTKVIHILNDKKAFVAYLADGEEATVTIPDRLKPIKPGYCLSNGCYREASRITLEITGVRVERLQDISEHDALAEGVRRRESTPVTDPAYCNYLAANLNDASEWFDRPSDSFISLWQSIYGAESWQHSPWVWVIEFKRVEE